MKIKRIKRIDDRKDRHKKITKGQPKGISNPKTSLIDYLRAPSSYIDRKGIVSPLQPLFPKQGSTFAFPSSQHSQWSIPEFIIIIKQN